MQPLRFEDITVIKQIFKSDNTNTYICEYKTYKILMKEVKISDKLTKDEINKKLSLMNFLNSSCDNIESYFGNTIEGKTMKIAKEYSEGEDNLYELIHNSKMKMTIKQKFAIMAGLASGLLFLHTLNPPVVHKNLKSTNVMVKFKENLIRSKISDVINFNVEFNLCEWTAPEVLRGEDGSVKSDIYSFGVILWELFSGKVPYSELNLNEIQLACNITNKNLRPDLKTLPDNTPGIIRDLISDCFKEDAKLRPDISEIKKLLEKSLATMNNK